jgi:hypothetical protein
MKIFSLILGTALVLSACEEKNENDFPSLEPGTYQLEIFDEHNVRLLTRTGTAIGLGSGSQIRMEDPKFITGDPDDPLAVFAYLLLTAGNNEKTWDESQNWKIDASAQAVLSQRYYNLSTDWRYRGHGGNIRIVESTDDFMKGSFTITMAVDTTGYYPYENWQANPLWGDQIVIKGFFVSRGW